MKIKWNVNTGYVHRMPDRIIEVPDEDLEDLSEEEQNNVIEQYVNKEFQRTITYGWIPIT